MQTLVLGNGPMGRALAGALAEAGHGVTTLRRPPGGRHPASVFADAEVSFDCSTGPAVAGNVEQAGRPCASACRSRDVSDCPRGGSIRSQKERMGTRQGGFPRSRRAREQRARRAAAVGFQSRPGSPELDPHHPVSPRLAKVLRRRRPAHGSRPPHRRVGEQPRGKDDSVTLLIEDYRPFDQRQLPRATVSMTLCKIASHPAREYRGTARLFDVASGMDAIGAPLR
jgi:hypothetical protein